MIRIAMPTVALHTHVFEKWCDSVNRVHGMPQAPRAFVTATGRWNSRRNCTPI